MKFIIIVCVISLSQFTLGYEIDAGKTLKLGTSNFFNQTKFGKLQAGNEGLTEPDLMKKNIHKKSITTPDILRVITNETFEGRNVIKNKDTNKETYLQVNMSTNNGMSILTAMKNEIIKQGCLKFNALAKNIKRAVKMTSNHIPRVLDQVTKIYITELDRYFYFVRNIKEVKTEIDWEFYFLHIVESSNKIFSSGTKTLYESMMASVNIKYYMNVNFLKLRDNIQNFVDYEKNDNLKYVCENFEVCVKYPAFSDHFSKLLAHILDLPNTSFKNVINILKNIIKRKVSFFESIMSKKMAIQISNTLMSFKTTQELREYLLMIRNIISQRYTLGVRNDNKVNERMKAVKILLEIVDKTFDKVGDEYNEYVLYKELIGIPVWDMEKSLKVSQSLEMYFTEIFNVLNAHLFSDTREEIQLLITFIITGSCKNNVLKEQLLTKGAKFIKNDKMFLPLSGLTVSIF